ncbi:MAG: hypothetical protein BJ554DRAFT_5866, partial [Olpidium bornovanus]
VHVPEQQRETGVTRVHAGFPAGRPPAGLAAAAAAAPRHAGEEEGAGRLLLEHALGVAAQRAREEAGHSGVPESGPRNPRNPRGAPAAALLAPAVFGCGGSGPARPCGGDRRGHGPKWLSGGMRGSRLVLNRLITKTASRPSPFPHTRRSHARSASSVPRAEPTCIIGRAAGHPGPVVHSRLVQHLQPSIGFAEEHLQNADCFQALCTPPTAEIPPAWGSERPASARQRRAARRRQAHEGPALTPPRSSRQTGSTRNAEAVAGDPAATFADTP